MSPGERVRRQGGFTLLETLLTVAIAAMVLLPLFGWAFVASRQSTDAAVRNVDGATPSLRATAATVKVGSGTSGSRTSRASASSPRVLGMDPVSLGNCSAATCAVHRRRAADIWP